MFRRIPRRTATALAAGILLAAELALSLIVLGVVFLALVLNLPPSPWRTGAGGFKAFAALAVISAILPAALTLAVAWRRFIARSGKCAPRWLALPLIAVVLCPVLSLRAVRASVEYVAWAERERTDAVRAEKRSERLALRTRDEGGESHLACDLVVKDPMATLEDMKRCRLRIESMADPSERWSELLKFTDGSRGFRSWDPYELELVPAWDLNNRLVVVRHDQEWFVRTFYETWLARPDAFHAGEDRAQLVSCIEAMGDWFGWKPSVTDVFSTEILPRLVERLAAESERLPLRPDEIRTTADAIDRARERARTERSPPRPEFAEPANAIGVAKAEDRIPRELHLWLRSTATSGDIGDVYLWYDGPWYDPFAPMLDHLANPATGIVVAVPPIPNSPSEH